MYDRVTGFPEGGKCMRFLFCFIQILVGLSCAGRYNLIELSEDEYIKPDFSQYFESVEVDVKPEVPPYSLPLDLKTIESFAKVNDLLLKNDEKAQRQLEQNGVVVIDWGKEHDIVAPFKFLKRSGIPLFITSDVLLHLYRIQFLESLKEVEEEELSDLLLALSERFLESSREQYRVYSNDLKEAAGRNTAFFGVAVRLLDPAREIPEFAADQVASEIEKIMAHQGPQMSDVFRYREDYSQYVPRGHYTRSERLSRYFRTMIWYGRMAFLLKPKLVAPYDAKIQTLQAALIAAFADMLKIDGQSAREIWDRIYEVTAFYVGLADDLVLSDYIDSMRRVFGTSFGADRLVDEDCLFELKKELALRSSPRIYGGTGQAGMLPSELTPEKLDEILDDTKGLRFIGQRFVPDSYIFGELVAPSVGELTGEPCFTSVFSLGIWIRAFPRGLDLMNILGSRRAGEILGELGDDKYQDYDEQVDKLAREFDEFSDLDWRRNLYWNWLRVLNSLLTSCPEGYPSFMRTAAWEDKQLSTALASWTGLRHATILYAKQSYTPMLTSAPPQEIAAGYVEPVPDVYARLLEMAQMTRKGLLGMGVLHEKTAKRLDALIEVLKKLITVSEKELENEELSEDECKFIENIDRHLQRIAGGLELETIMTTFVCDVHTDMNTQQVLQEGSGYTNLLVAAVRDPDGGMTLAAGPVLSYHEFKQPMSERLTDEMWVDLLREEKAPEEGW
jgi:hypothetical protein